VDRGCTNLLSTEDQEQLYTGDCYIIRYSYVEDGKDYHLFFAWSGKNSVKVRSLSFCAWNLLIYQKKVVQSMAHNY
jgi:advillin